MAVESRVTQEEIKKEPEKPIDREKTCPLLLRVFTTNNGRHHRMDEFSRGNVPSSELQIYTWMDATLKELTSLVKEVYPEARKKGTHFNFAIVFTDLKRPGYRVARGARADHYGFQGLLHLVQMMPIHGLGVVSVTPVYPRTPRSC
ncbi:histone deacetylase complex subunit SAP18 isoform 2-T2 [Phoenicopterus ruber ruber]